MWDCQNIDLKNSRKTTSFSTLSSSEMLQFIWIITKSTIASETHGRLQLTPSYLNPNTTQKDRFFWRPLARFQTDLWHLNNLLSNKIVFRRVGSDEWECDCHFWHRNSKNINLFNISRFSTYKNQLNLALVEVFLRPEKNQIFTVFRLVKMYFYKASNIV